MNKSTKDKKDSEDKKKKLFRLKSRIYLELRFILEPVV